VSKQIKRILVIGAGHLQVDTIKRIRELGFEAYCADANPLAEGFQYAGGYKVIDVLDKDACLAYAKELEIDGVMTAAATVTLPTVAFIAKQLGLTATSQKAAAIATSKYEIKKRLSDNKLNISGKFLEIGNISEMEGIKKYLEFPCVVKPSDGSGSKGITIVNNSNELERAAEHAFNESRSKRIYFEKFIEGDEYGVECFVYENRVYVLGILKKIMTQYPTCSELGHRVPSGLPEEIESKIKLQVTKALEALYVTFGSVNIDLILSDKENEPYIIDLGMRIGGNLIATHIIPFSTGIHIIDRTIQAVVGEKICIETLFEKPVATRLIILKPGVIKQIGNISALIDYTGILDVVFTKKVGDTSREYIVNSDTCGWVVATGETASEAEKNAEDAYCKIKEMIVID
jgi:biotin carboxylase